jgi:hypothetical protein
MNSRYVLAPHAAQDKAVKAQQTVWSLSSETESRSCQVHLVPDIGERI